MLAIRKFDDLILSRSFKVSKGSNDILNDFFFLGDR